MTIPSAPNPYAPPAAEIVERPIESTAAGELASRWQRLGAVMFDGLPTVVALIPFFIGIARKAMSGVAVADTGSLNPAGPFLAAGTLGVVSLVLVGVVMAIQWTLLGVRGQTVGKMVAGIRVVRTDGSRATFFRTVVVRYWPFFLLGLVGNVGSAVGAVDSLFVFRRDKRCLHDLMADTKVVRVARRA